MGLTVLRSPSGLYIFLNQIFIPQRPAPVDTPSVPYYAEENLSPPSVLVTLSRSPAPGR